jgi:hypothetical protein
MANARQALGVLKPASAKHGGRRKKLGPQQRALAIGLSRQKKHPVDAICRTLDISTRTLYRYVVANEEAQRSAPTGSLLSRLVTQFASPYVYTCVATAAPPLQLIAMNTPSGQTGSFR